MQRRAFMLGIRPGMKDEYVRRHDEIWPEMASMLKDAGIVNYSIWWIGDSVFGYYESEDLSKTDEFKAKSPVQTRWQEYMSDVIAPDSAISPELVFYLT